MNQYLSALDSSGWLQHVRSVLEAAIFIARVREKRSTRIDGENNRSFLGGGIRKEECVGALFRWLGSYGPVLFFSLVASLSVLSIHSRISSKDRRNLESI